ncbi:transaldolase family protein [Planctomycetota bacterium]
MFNIYQTKAGAHARRIRMPIINSSPDDKKLTHPASWAPRIFADSATFSDIEPLRKAGIVTGLTTNPTLMKMAGAQSRTEAEKISKDLLKLMAPHPVSLELTELTEKKMIDQARQLSSWGENVVVKVPIGGYTAVDPSYDPYTGLKVIHALWEKNIKTNATLIFNSTQAFWAANAGATYISPFLGRLADYAYKNDHPERPPGNSLYWIEDHKNSRSDQMVFNTDYVASGGARKDIGVRLIQEISVIFTNYDIHSEILAASIRNFAQVSECLLAGADILTVPTHVLEKVPFHPLTQAGMKTFFDDSKVFDK